MKDKEWGVSFEKINITKTFSVGNFSTLDGFDDYYKAKDIFSKYFKGEINGVSPYFFECYKNEEDSGFVVDVNKKEIRVSNMEQFMFCKVLHSECKAAGLEFKIKE